MEAAPRSMMRFFGVSAALHAAVAALAIAFVNIGEGDGATVQWRGKFRSSITGETAETDLVDVIRFKEGRISSFIEFCDTALAARLMGQAPARK